MSARQRKIIRAPRNLAAREAEVKRLAKRAFALYSEGTSKNTLRAYKSDWQNFITWCQDLGTLSLPSSEATLLLYVTHMAEHYRPSSIERALAGICYVHKHAGHPRPVTSRVSDHLQKVRVVLGDQVARAAPLLAADLERMVVAIDAHKLSARDIRDKAVLLVGWCAALRRSEVAALNIKDVKFKDKGIILSIRRSKADQAGRGVELALLKSQNQDLCPVRSLKEWIKLRGESGAHLFSQNVYEKIVLTRRMPDWQILGIVERWVKASGVEPEDPELHFSPHSLRAGFITEAARANKSDTAIMKHSRHKTHRVFLDYVHKAREFEQSPLEGLL